MVMKSQITKKGFSGLDQTWKIELSKFGNSKSMERGVTKVLMGLVDEDSNLGSSDSHIQLGLSPSLFQTNNINPSMFKSTSHQPDNLISPKS